jgi:hypothetical protein
VPVFQRGPKKLDAVQQSDHMQGTARDRRVAQARNQTPGASNIMDVQMKMLKMRVHRGVIV